MEMVENNKFSGWAKFSAPGPENGKRELTNDTEKDSVVIGNGVQHKPG